MNYCVHNTGESVCYKSRSDDHSTPHIYVLSRIVGGLLRISVSPE